MAGSSAKDDRAWLYDMMESAGQALSYVAGMTFDQFWDDSRTRDAVAMRLTVVGEAARNVSAATACGARTVTLNHVVWAGSPVRGSIR